MWYENIAHTKDVKYTIIHTDANICYITHTFINSIFLLEFLHKHELQYFSPTKPVHEKKYK